MRPRSELNAFFGCEVVHGNRFICPLSLCLIAIGDGDVNDLFICAPSAVILDNQVVMPVGEAYDTFIN